LSVIYTPFEDLEKGALQDYQERNAKLTAQKNDLENQLRVSIPLILNH